jgi:hypothetical protein
MKFALTKKTFALVAALDVNRGNWLAAARIETSEERVDFRRMEQKKKEKTGAFSPEILRRFFTFFQFRKN